MVRDHPDPPFSNGGLAQLGEHLLCKQGVVGSIPSSSTITSLPEVVNLNDLGLLYKARRLRFAACAACSLTIRRVEISVADGKCLFVKGQTHRAISNIIDCVKEQTFIERYE